MSRKLSGKGKKIELFIVKLCSLTDFVCYLLKVIPTVYFLSFLES